MRFLTLIVVCTVAISLSGCWMTQMPPTTRVDSSVFIQPDLTAASQVVKDVYEYKYGALESKSVNVSYTSYFMGFCRKDTDDTQVPADLRLDKCRTTDFVAVPFESKIGNIKIGDSLLLDLGEEGKYRGIIQGRENDFGELPHWVVLTDVSRLSGANPVTPTKPEVKHTKPTPPLKTINLSFGDEEHNLVVPTTLDFNQLAASSKGADIELSGCKPFTPLPGQPVVIKDSGGKQFVASYSPREYGREYVIHLENIRSDTRTTASAKN